MEGFKLSYYKYNKESREFQLLHRSASSSTHALKELTIIIKHLETNMIQYEVDENFNIKMRNFSNQISHTGIADKKKYNS